MCGRFALYEEAEVIEREFGIQIPFELPPRYDIRPTEKVLAFTSRGAEWMKWSLLPSWEKSDKIKYATFNARIEDAVTKPAFRGSLRENKRCIIPASGFYEWKEVGKHKERYLFRRKDHRIMAMAGLFDEWTGPSSGKIVSCTILTTEANEIVRPIHAKHRMPVILEAEEIGEWLSPQNESELLLGRHETPFASDKMEAFEVDSSIKVESSKLIEPRERGLF